MKMRLWGREISHCLCREETFHCSTEALRIVEITAKTTDDKPNDLK
jgi:hypothetical protein